MFRSALMLIGILASGLAADPPRGMQVQAASAGSEARTALVIGNGGYRDAPLKNPANDARAMAEALRGCGFAVTELEDANRERMVQALRDFGSAIQGGGVGLFYFAGHGMQVKGKNYLVPVGADIATEDEVAYGTLDADAVLAKMETAHNRLNLVILDACRNNPFGRSFRSTQQGLAQMDAPAGSYIAFATAPGRTASDGGGSHGLYTQFLLASLRTPGLKVEDVFKWVRANVMQATRGEQVPWENSSIVGDFYFVPGDGALSVPETSAPAPMLGLPQPSFKVGKAPRPTPAEARLLEVMRGKGGMDRALKMAKPLAAKGSIYGKFVIELMDFQKGNSHRAILNGAKQGIPLAMAYQANHMAKNPLLPSDLTDARALLEMAVALGEPSAKAALGTQLLGDKLGPHDFPRAERLLKEAAEEFLPYWGRAGEAFWEHQEKLAMPKAEADAKGLAFLKRGAELGDLGSVMELAFAFQSGEHVPEDPKEAIHWCIEAANGTNDPLWARQAGQLYLHSDDPKTKDVDRGIKWLSKAALKDDEEAMEELARVYEQGKLVPKDLAQAYFWATVASRRSKVASRFAPRFSEMAESLKKRIGKELSPAERTRIESQTAKWTPKKQ